MSRKTIRLLEMILIQYIFFILLEVGLDPSPFDIPNNYVKVVIDVAKNDKGTWFAEYVMAHWDGVSISNFYTFFGTFLAYLVTK